MFLDRLPHVMPEFFRLERFWQELVCAAPNHFHPRPKCFVIESSDKNNFGLSSSRLDIGEESEGAFKWLFQVDHKNVHRRRRNSAYQCLFRCTADDLAVYPRKAL